MIRRGAERPLSIAPFHTFEVHGESGIGYATLPEGRIVEPGGVDFLVETLGARPGEVSIAAVGPLTNLALAEQRRPGSLKAAKHIVVMGGAIDVPGNTSAVAEYNFYADPHAARIVLESGAKITLVPLDVTQRVGVTADEIEARVGSLASARAQFFEDATRVVVELGLATGGFPGVHLHDPAAVALLLRPDLFEVERVRATVEPEGVYTAGQVVVDRRRTREGRPAIGETVDIAMRVDADAVLDLFFERAVFVVADPAS